jgi:tRNA(Ile)-lysidine synthase
MALSEELEGCFLRFLEEHLGSSDPSGLLIAISGGLDSTALLKICSGAAARHGRPIVAGHVHHGLRPDADQEAGRMEALCAGMGTPFRLARIQFENARPSEAEMRRARLRALSRLASESGCRYVLLGHQRDDLAETVIMNLIRGTGIRGMAGIRPVRGRFAHPLLDVPRSDLKRYLENQGVPWVEDPMNFDLGRTRNRIRHQVLPLLSEIRPGAVETIARAARHLRGATDALETEARVGLGRCRLPSPIGEIRLDGGILRSYHYGLADFMLRLAVESISCTTDNVSSAVWGQIAEVIRDRRSGRFAIHGSTIVEITGRMVRIAPGSPHQRPERPEAGTGAIVRWIGRTAWRGGYLRARLVRIPSRFDPAGRGRIKIRGTSRTQVFDAADLDLGRFPRIRPPRPGDRLALEYSGGHGRLSDLVSERGVPLRLRSGQPVIEDPDGRILWAPGIRRAGIALVRESTQVLWIARWFGPLPVDRAAAGGKSRGENA